MNGHVESGTIKEGDRVRYSEKFLKTCDPKMVECRRGMEGTVIAGLKALCGRAAAALEDTLPLTSQTWNNKASARSKLIAELKEAAK